MLCIASVRPDPRAKDPGEAIKNITLKAAAAMKSGFQDLGKRLRKGSEDFEAKSKEDLKKLKATFEKAFAKETLKERADIVKDKIVGQWKKTAAEFKASKLGQKLEVTKEEFQVVRVHGKPRKVCEGKALFAFNAQQPGEMDMAEDANIEILEVIDDAEDQVKRMEEEFARRDKATGSTGMIDMDDVMHTLVFAGMSSPPHDSGGKNRAGGGASKEGAVDAIESIEKLFANYGVHHTLFHRNGTEKKPEEARMTMEKLREYMHKQFAAGSIWLRVRNQVICNALTNLWCRLNLS